MFIESEEKAEEYTNRKENAGYAIAGQLFAVVQIADHPGENIRKADAIGRGSQ